MNTSVSCYMIKIMAVFVSMFAVQTLQCPVALNGTRADIQCIDAIFRRRMRLIMDWNHRWWTQLQILDVVSMEISNGLLCIEDTEWMYFILSMQSTYRSHPCWRPTQRLRRDAEYRTRPLRDRKWESTNRNGWNTKHEYTKWVMIGILESRRCIIEQEIMRSLGMEYVCWSRWGDRWHTIDIHVMQIIWKLRLWGEFWVPTWVCSGDHWESYEGFDIIDIQWNGWLVMMVIEVSAVFRRGLNPTLPITTVAV